MFAQHAPTLARAVCLIALFGSGCTGEISATGPAPDAASGGGIDDITTDAGSPASCDIDELNGHELTESQKTMIEHVAHDILPGLERIAGSREEAIEWAVDVTWWSLKEGVLDTPNPFGFSLCDRPRVNLTDQPLSLCDRDAWQVGVAAIQSPRPGAVSTTTVKSKIADYEGLIELAFPGDGVEAHLRHAVELAEHDQEIADAVVDSSAHLRASWLLRIGTIGFAVQAPIVHRECIDDDRSWCSGSGWEQTANFAADRSTSERTRAELSTVFDRCAG